MFYILFTDSRVQANFIASAKRGRWRVGSDAGAATRRIFRGLYLLPAWKAARNGDTAVCRELRFLRSDRHRTRSDAGGATSNQTDQNVVENVDTGSNIG